MSGHLNSVDFSKVRATIVGYGAIGKEYAKTLNRLGLKEIRICSRSPQRGVDFPGGWRVFREKPSENEAVILALPIADLIPAALHFRELGFKKFLIEKPVALKSADLKKFRGVFETEGVEAFCAYNRAAYPSLLEAEKRIEEEGGITSCVYTMTEMVRPDWPSRFSKEELARWGVANSLHVASMAHRLIGLPKEWKTYRSGFSLPWHPSGTVFTGAGLSEKNIPFSYHADWTSKGRWSLEVETREASYRFCPLEKLLRKTNAVGEWEEISFPVSAPEIKPGFAEQAAAFLSPPLRKKNPPVSLAEAEALVRFGEEVFGYEE